MRRPPTRLIALLALGSALLVSGCSQQGDPVSFGAAPDRAGNSTHADAKADGGNGEHGTSGKVRMPSAPRTWETQRTLADGTTVGVTTLKGRKSGFEGKVWVWAPKQYFEKRYEHSAFPVLIALPGSHGYPTNYWMGGDLKLQENIAKFSEEGRSLPFVVVMPVQNADKDTYYDGSDIPGQPKMGTWMADDVPELVRENFRTFDDPRGWGFFGSSSGGYIGLKMVLQHPDRFGSVIAGGPDTRPDSPLWKGHEKEQRANSPEHLAEALIARGGPDVNVSIMLGTLESGQAATKDFLRKYGRGPVHTDLHMIENGRHSGKQYAKSLGDGPLEWISRRMLAPSE